MASVGVRQRVANPGKKSNFYQRMQAAKRAKAARMSNAGWGKYSREKKSWSHGRVGGDGGSRKQKKALWSGNDAKARWLSQNRRDREDSRVGNVGEILTVSLGALAGNPGKRKGTKSMARRKRRVNGSKRRVVRRRRAVRTVNRRHRRRTSNGLFSKRRKVTRRRNRAVVKVYNRRRRRNGVTSRRRRTFRRRRNPGILGNLLGGTPGMIVGILGGAAATKFVVDMLPASFKQGWMGYGVTAVVAYGQGKLIGKVTKSPQLGRNLMIGGFTLLGLQIASQMFPSVMGYLPFGLKGMGMIAPSNFYTPQVNAPGSMSRFIAPAAIATAMVPANNGVRGLGMIGRRSARMGRIA